MPSRHQWIGAAALAVMMLLTIGILLFVPRTRKPSTIPIPMTDEQDSVPAFRLRPFDPNTADSLTLRSIGLTEWQTHSLLQYRRKGGRWRTADDFARLYGLSDSAFQELKPYIAIDTMPFYRERMIRKALRDSARRADSLLRDSIYHARYALQYGEPPVKKDTILDLNSADTAELMLIKGIGPFTARQIIRYREQLGGYVSPLQLRELAQEDFRLEGLDTLTQYFFATTDSVHPLPVNYCSLRRLAAHPYLNFTQAEAIYDLRRRRINLKSIDEIRKIDCISTEDIERLKPYLDFTITPAVKREPSEK